MLHEKGYRPAGQTPMIKGRCQTRWVSELRNKAAVEE